MNTEDENIVKKAKTILREKGIVAFIRSAFDFMKQKLKSQMVHYAIFKIKRFNRESDLDELVRFAFDDVKQLIRPAQVRGEITGLLEILKERKPRTILEIGTANGGTLFLISCVAARDAKILSIDLPGGEFGGGYPKWRIRMYKSFGSPGQIHLIRADSHKESTFELAKGALNGAQLDFLFIDGDHTYEGVKRDFEMYSHLVKPGGIIALHDVAFHPPETDCEVDRFWNEIKNKYPFKEFIEDKNQGWGGIGLLEYR